MKSDIIIGVLAILAGVFISYFLWYKFDGRRKKRLQFALLALQSHTNPHFVRNVLQSINWFILNNEKVLASNYLCDFSRLMEDILIFSKKKVVTLEEKLKFLDLYIKLQHLRHKDKFDYVPFDSQENENSTIKVDKKINPETFLLPPLLIQPYVENAIEHGLKPKSTKGILSVNFKYEGSKLICQIKDNGIGIKASKKRQQSANEKRSNIGIVNTKKRIEIIRKLLNVKIRAITSELSPGAEEPGTVVTLIFPSPYRFSSESGIPSEVYRV